MYVATHYSAVNNNNVHIYLPPLGHNFEVVAAQVMLCLYCLLLEARENRRVSSLNLRTVSEGLSGTVLELSFRQLMLNNGRLAWQSQFFWKVELTEQCLMT